MKRIPVILLLKQNNTQDKKRKGELAHVTRIYSKNFLYNILHLGISPWDFHSQQSKSFQRSKTSRKTLLLQVFFLPFLWSSVTYFVLPSSLSLSLPATLSRNAKLILPFLPILFRKMIFFLSYDQPNENKLQTTNCWILSSSLPDFFYFFLSILFNSRIFKFFLFFPKLLFPPPVRVTKYIQLRVGLCKRYSWCTFVVKNFCQRKSLAKKTSWRKKKKFVFQRTP